MGRDTGWTGLVAVREGTARPSRCRQPSRTVLVEHVQVAETPAGQRYTVVTAPPGSALDAGGRFGTGGVIGALVAVGMVVARSARRGWRNASPISKPPKSDRLLSCLRFGTASGPSRHPYPPVGNGTYVSVGVSMGWCACSRPCFVDSLRVVITRSDWLFGSRADSLLRTMRLTSVWSRPLALSRPCLPRAVSPGGSQARRSPVAQFSTFWAAWCFWAWSYTS